MIEKIKLILLTLINFFICSCSSVFKTDKSLMEGFMSPPKSAACGVYWYFMDGNYSKEGITKDLESMVNQGIYHAIILEVQQGGIPLGDCKMLSDEWKDMYKHIVNESKRLGIHLTLGIGPGWTGSGGPWVEGCESMKHLVAEHVIVEGGELKSVKLPSPQPQTPFFGLNQFPDDIKNKWNSYYEDVAVLAFPLDNLDNIICASTDESALYYRAPYSSKPNVKRYLSFNPDSIINGSVVSSNKVIDLSKEIIGDSIEYKFPKGKWCVVRFGSRNNGAITRPAPVAGLGFECDKMDTTAVSKHLNQFLGQIFKYVGFEKRTNDEDGGIVAIHMDSWEMGAQNWTDNFRKEFIARRGYDPLPYYLAYYGLVVNNSDYTQRFLWDMRRTAQELIFEYHVDFVKKYAHEKGLDLSIEPYDMNPTSDLELCNLADIPMCEFWSKGRGFNTTFSVFEATSLAHLNGISVVQAEAFTSGRDGWDTYPENMKNQTDWALAAGINRMFFHTFQHQSFGDRIRPGVTMGHHGTHWNRLQTWWNMSGEFHEYISRCQFMLQQGKSISDILFLTPEKNPYVFRPPVSSVTGDKWMPDKKGYGFDAIPPSLLYDVTVKDGKIHTKGSDYEILVLPNTKAMTPELLEKIKELLMQGAKVVGLPPQQSPSLNNFPNADKKIKDLVSEIWDDSYLTATLTSRKIGAGTLYTGKVLRDTDDMQYPDYDVLSGILKRNGVEQDFQDSEKRIRYIHRRTENEDIYFLSNKTREKGSVICSFRITDKVPKVWNPVTKEISDIRYNVSKDGLTTLSLYFNSHQSFFIVFTDDDGTIEPILKIKKEKTINLNSDWSITFDSIIGNKISVNTDSLFDWSESTDSIIKYFSGTAVYRKDFYYNETKISKVILNLGDVEIMARVWLNGKLAGVLWTSPWEIEVTNLLQSGENHIEIEVVNTWRNRMIGDSFYPNDWKDHKKWPEWLLKGKERPKTKRATFATYSPYKPTDTLAPSGLLGPVELIIIQ